MTTTLPVATLARRHQQYDFRPQPGGTVLVAWKTGYASGRRLLPVGEAHLAGWDGIGPKTEGTTRIVQPRLLSEDPGSSMRARR